MKYKRLWWLWWVTAAAHGVQGQDCSTTPRAFDGSRVSVAIEVKSTAPEGEIIVDASESLEDVGARPVRYFWCVQDKSFLGTLPPSTLAPTAQTAQPAPAPTAIQPTPPPTFACPNRALSSIPCGPAAITREECWARNCCFDPTNEGNKCYPTSTVNGGRRLENISGNGLEADGLPPSCKAGHELETTKPVLEMSSVKLSGSFRFQLRIEDGCKEFEDVSTTFTVNTADTEQCLPYHAAPPGTENSCYCADEFMREDQCPTCAVAENDCPDGFIHDLCHDQCVYDSQVCLSEVDACVDRVNSPKERTPEDLLYPPDSLECVEDIDTDSPTAYPSVSPTGLPTHMPSDSPTNSPSITVTDRPTRSPTISPTTSPPTTGAPSTAPTLSPTRDWCHTKWYNSGYVKKKRECHLPFVYIRGKIRLTFEYPPLFTEARPYRVERTDIDIYDPENRWCPPLGTRVYNFGSKETKKLWGVAKCSNPARYPTAQPTKVNGRPTKVGRPQAGCVSPCQVGFFFNETRRLCEPLAKPICFHQHYYDRASCSVRKCGVNNSTWVEFNLTASVDASSGKVRLFSHHDLSANDIEDVQISWLSIPEGKSITELHRDQVDGGINGISFQVTPSPILLGEEFHVAAHISDKCGRKGDTDLTFGNYNQPPVPRMTLRYDAPSETTQYPKDLKESDMNVQIRFFEDSLHSSFELELDGSESYDPEGQPLVSMEWHVTPILAGQQQPTEIFKESRISILVESFSVYKVRLSISDAAGAVGLKDLNIQVRGVALPVADASRSATILHYGPLSRARLDASLSSDDGMINSYHWKFVSFSPQPLSDAAMKTFHALRRMQVPGFNAQEEEMPSPRIESPTSPLTFVTNLAVGSYTFLLTVVDDDALNATTLVEFQVTLDFDSAPLQLNEPLQQTILTLRETPFVRWSLDQEIDPEQVRVGLEMSTSDGKPVKLFQAEGGQEWLIDPRRSNIRVQIPTDLKVPASYELTAGLYVEHQRASTVRQIPLPFPKPQVSLVIRNPFSFSESPWGSCSGSCVNGLYIGTQERQVSCRDTRSGLQIDVATCSRWLKSQAPESSRRCYSTCTSSQETFLVLGSWSKCSSACESAQEQTRSVLCYKAGSPPRETTTSVCNTVTAKLIDTDNGKLLRRRCSTARCGQESFSKKTFFGDNSRHVCACRSPQLALVSEDSRLCMGKEPAIPVAPSLCAEPGTGTGDSETQQSSATSRCEIPENCENLMWLISPWSYCSGHCGENVTTTRNVVCYDKFAQRIVDDAFCVSLGEKPVVSRKCNQGLRCSLSQWFVSSWTPCALGACSCTTCPSRTREVKCLQVDASSGEMKVSEDASVCDKVLEKPQESEACGDIPSSCFAEEPSSRRLSNTCTTKDRFGACCASGMVNDCGVCDGPQTASFDVSGACCESGVLDASGSCCSSGYLDACGVCDGVGASCSQRILYDFEVLQNETDVYLGTFGSFALTQLVSSIGNELAVPSSRLELVDVFQMDAGSSNMNAMLQAEVSVSPDVEAAGWQETLVQQVLEKGSPFSIGVRSGICGNGVCESGELCTSERIDSSSGCCMEDCLIQVLDCPLGENGRTCSGHGACLASSGACSCFALQGYRGDACSECLPDWMEDSNGVCVQGFIQVSPTESPTAATITTTAPTTLPTQAVGQSPVRDPLVTDSPTTTSTTHESKAPSASPTASPIKDQSLVDGKQEEDETSGMEKYWPLFFLLLLPCICTWVYIGRKQLKRRRRTERKVFITNGIPHHFGQGKHAVVPSPSHSVKEMSLVQSSPQAKWRQVGSEESEDESEGLGAMAPDVHMEGWLRMRVEGAAQEQGKELVGPKWETMYFVLFKSTKRINFYMGMSPSNQYNVYTGELGSISLQHGNLAFVRSSSKQRFRDRVFEIGLRGASGKNLTTHLFFCSTSMQRQLWVDALSHYVGHSRHIMALDLDLMPSAATSRRAKKEDQDLFSTTSSCSSSSVADFEEETALVSYRRRNSSSGRSKPSDRRKPKSLDLSFPRHVNEPAPLPPFS